MALIQCLLGAAAPTLSSQTYSFDRDRHGRFVCEVFDLVHIQCLLSRDDVYREVKETPDELVKEHIETLLGSSVLPSMVPIADGFEVQLGAVVARAHNESGLSIKDWNGLADADREKLLADAVEAMKAEAAPPVPDPTPEQEEPAPAVASEPEPEATEPEADKADKVDGAGDGQEEPALDAVVAGVVTEAAVKPTTAPRRGRRGR